MQILTYSPSVEAYVAVKTETGFEYHDMTKDIVSCTVNRIQNGASTFTLRLINRDNKYVALMQPMDRVFIRAVKEEAYPLIAGYVTSAPQYNLYRGDVTISGSCPIYRLENLYWDPGLRRSQELMQYGNEDGSYEQVVYNLLTKVGGYTADRIAIGSMPQAVMDWARSLYEARLADTLQARDMADEFYKILQTHGPKFTGTAASGAASEYVGGVTVLGEGLDFDMSESAFVKKWGDAIEKYYRNDYPWAVEGVVACAHYMALKSYQTKVDVRCIVSSSISESGGGRNLVAPFNFVGITPTGSWGVGFSSWEDCVDFYFSDQLACSDWYRQCKTIKDWCMTYRDGMPPGTWDEAYYAQDSLTQQMVNDYFEPIFAKVTQYANGG